MEYTVRICNGSIETEVLEEVPKGVVQLDIYKNELEDVLRIALRNNCDVLIRKITEE